MSHAVPTVQDIVLMVLDTLGELYYGTATAGAMGSLTDADLAHILAEDTFNYGTIIITDTTDDAAPKSEARVVSNYIDDDGTVEVSVNFTVAPAAGDRYALAESRWTIPQIIGAINRALVAIGDMPQIDLSLSTSGALSRYTLPSGINKRNLAQVYTQNVSTADDEEPVPVVNWYVRPDDELVFHTSPPSGKTLELHYNGPHTAVEAIADTIDTQIALDRMVAETVYQLVRSRIRQTDGADRELVDMWNDVKDELNEARSRHRIEKLSVQPRRLLTSWGRRRGSRAPSGRGSKYGPWLNN